MTIHPRITLVTTEVVGSVKGCSREQVYDQVDGGRDTFLWVFDVSAELGKSRRELRFWTRELERPAEVRGLKLVEVLPLIVPRRDLFPSQFPGLPYWQVRDLLRVSRELMLQLRTEMQIELRSGAMWVRRDSIETFLRRRWVSAATENEMAGK